MDLKIVVAGPRGKMGATVMNMMKNHPEFKIVALLDYKTNQALADFNIPVYTNSETCFKQMAPDVLVDFTTPQASFKHITSAIKHGVKVVSGTTGFSKDQFTKLKKMTNYNNVGCIIVPNFSLGAVLMMEFARIAIKYFSHVEIIDKHHDQKHDSPSGTAIRTAELINETKKVMNENNDPKHETIQHARGATYNNINIHSIRLPGYMAHHEVVFGGSGEIFTIKHDSISRESFMDGLKLAIDRVMNINYFIHGLENIISIND